MVSVGLVVFFVGATLIEYGAQKLAGWNYTLPMLIVPGKFVQGQPPKDSGGSAGPTPCTAAQTALGFTMVGGVCTAPKGKGAGVGNGAQGSAKGCWKTLAACNADTTTTGVCQQAGAGSGLCKKGYYYKFTSDAH
jgi:hypothetical protein